MNEIFFSIVLFADIDNMHGHLYNYHPKHQNTKMHTTTYLNDQVRDHHVKHFFDGVGSCVDNVSSLLHGEDQWHYGITLGHRTHTHLMKIHTKNVSQSLCSCVIHTQ